MKIKKIISPIKSVSVLLVFGIILHSLGWIYAPSGTSFIEPWIILQTWGLSLFLLISIVSGSNLPTNIYKTDESKYIFYNNNYDIILKCLLFILSGLMLYYGSYLESEKAIIDSTKSNWFEIIFFSIIIISIIGQSLFGIYSLIRNKKDHIIIDSKEIYWFDDQTGEHKLQITSVEKVIISENEIVFYISQSSEVMSLKNMSLMAFNDKIKEVLFKYIAANKIYSQ